jgi:hypothetical protein
MPKRIFGSKLEKAKGGWRRMHNEELIICIPKLIQ